MTSSQLKCVIIIFSVWADSHCMQNYKIIVCLDVAFFRLFFFQKQQNRIETHVSLIGIKCCKINMWSHYIYLFNKSIVFFILHVLIDIWRISSLHLQFNFFIVYNYYYSIIFQCRHHHSCYITISVLFIYYLISIYCQCAENVICLLTKRKNMGIIFSRKNSELKTNALRYCFSVGIVFDVDILEKMLQRMQ